MTARRADARRQLRDEVASYVRELISAGEVRTGTLLRLAPLAETLEMSATPVREGLLLLAQEGWVIQEPNRGFRVSARRRQDVVDAYLVMAFLSGELAARAATRASPDVIRELRELDAAIHSLGDDPGEEAQRLNIRFHGAIAKAADSPRITALVSQLSRFVPHRFWHVVPGWLELNRSDHAAIIDAIEEGSPEDARAAMKGHIDRTAAVLTQHLDETSHWDWDGGSIESSELAAARETAPDPNAV